MKGWRCDIDTFEVVWGLVVWQSLEDLLEYSSQSLEVTSSSSKTKMAVDWSAIIVIMKKRREEEGAKSRDYYRVVLRNFDLTIRLNFTSKVGPKFILSPISPSSWTLEQCLTSLTTTVSFTLLFFRITWWKCIIRIKWCSEIDLQSLEDLKLSWETQDQPNWGLLQMEIMYQIDSE